MTQTAETEQVKQALRDEFPGLTIICGRPLGRWFALSGPLADDDPGPFVDVEAATPEELRRKLQELARPRIAP